MPEAEEYFINRQEQTEYSLIQSSKHQFLLYVQKVFLMFSDTSVYVLATSAKCNFWFLLSLFEFLFL